MYITVLLDVIIVFWSMLDHWTPKWRNRMIFYDTHNTLLV